VLEKAGEAGAALLPRVDDDRGFTEAARRIYIRLSECLVENQPWEGRDA
jgi:hypothetical protein